MNKKELENKINSIARREVRLKTNRELFNAEKKEFNKLYKKQMKVNYISNIIKEEINKQVTTKNVKFRNNVKGNIKEFIISDLHYTGGEDDKWVAKIFSKIKGRVNKNDNIIISFLGDDIEGIGAHKSQLLSTNGMVEPAIKVAKLYKKYLEEISNIVKSLHVIYVPESNHGQFRQLGSKASELPNEDAGYMIFEILKSSKKYTMSKTKDGKVLNNGSFYLHGHQKYAKNKSSLVGYLGINKHIIMGHFHHFKITQHKQHYIVVAPSCKRDMRLYEKHAGYDSFPAILMMNKTNKDIKSWEIIPL